MYLFRKQLFIYFVSNILLPRKSLSEFFHFLAVHFCEQRFGLKWSKIIKQIVLWHAVTLFVSHCLKMGGFLSFCRFVGQSLAWHNGIPWIEASQNHGAAVELKCNSNFNISCFSNDWNFNVLIYVRVRYLFFLWIYLLTEDIYWLK